MASDSNVEAEWEYNCPQYVDFTAPISGDDNADEWFDFDHENEGGFSLHEHDEDGSSDSKATENDADEKENDNVEKVPSNLVTSLEEWQAGSSTTTSSNNNKRRPSHRKNKKISKGNGVKKRPGVPPRKSVSPKSKRRKVSPSRDVVDGSSAQAAAKPVRRRSAARRSVSSLPTRSASLDKSNRSVCSLDDSRTGEAKQKKVTAVKKLTMPTTPLFMKRVQKSVSTSVKSTEQMQIEQVEQLRKELEMKRKIAKDSFKKLKAVKPKGPMKSANVVTQPEEFHFATDSRVKSHGMETRQDSKDFVSQLRCPSQPVKPGHYGPTKPQPFHLSSDARKRKRPDEVSSDDAGYKFESVAEKLIKFSSRTPERFRTRPGKKTASPLKSKSVKAELTVPHTPNLETRSRKRQVAVLSAVEKENREVEEIKKHQFKAHPVNHKILESSNIGVKKVPSKPTTEAVGFSFDTEAREKTAHNNTVDEEKYQFHARPLPKAILQGVVGLKPKAELPLTVPESPAFALKNRVREKPQEKSVVEEPPVKSQPVPHTGVPFHPRLEHRITVPEPFSFEKRDKAMLQKKEKKIQHELEEKNKKYEFKAQPLPDSSPDTLPEKKARSVTNPQPFHLESELRGASRAENWSSKIEDDLRQQRAQGKFKARPNNVIYQDPFVPKKSDKELTDVEEFDLSTEKRSTRRQEFLNEKKRQEEEAEEERLQREERRLEEEKREVCRIRSAAVHKAQPVANYKGVTVVPSTKPLTEPQTPHFATDMRTRKVRS